MDNLVTVVAAANSGLLVTAIIAVGLGLVFLFSDWRTPSSRWMAFALIAAGAAIAVNAQLLVLAADGLPWWARLAGFIETLAFVCGVEWGIRVGQTTGGNEVVKERRLGASRWAELLIGAYALLAAMFPEQRMQYLIGALEFGGLASPMFWLFATLPILGFGLIYVAAIRMLRHRPDKAEAGRIISMLVVMPLLGLAFIVPVDWAPITVALAQVIFVMGALRYFMIQGARAQFMARFMAPQVAELVRTRGLRHAMRRHRVRVTIVAADIRGFTSFAQGVAPEVVLRLLREFYSAVGEASERYGGTIKDLAGDGVLIVMGAPASMPDHAERALKLARRLQSHTRPVVRRYSDALGLGVGVATGEVAVGIVGQGARFEYVAVGPAVNLASRLCDRARDGEARVDATTLELAGEQLHGRPQRRYVKGLREPVATYLLKA